MFSPFAAFRSLTASMQATFWMLASILCFSFAVALVKQLGQHLHVSQIIALRQIFVLAAMLPTILKASEQGLIKGIRINRPGLQATRAISAFVGILAGFTAIIHLPLATATTISFTRTFFITIFAVALLGERVGIRRISAMAVGFLGIVIVARPQQLIEAGWEGLDINMLLALLAAACIGANRVIIRRQTHDDRPVLMIFWQAIAIGLAMIPVAWWHWQSPSWHDLFLIAILGLFTVSAQLSMVVAHKLGEASALAPLDYLRLLSMTFLGWLLFGEWPDIYTWIGAAIILVSTLYIIRREAQLKKNRNKKIQP